jgi:RNA polymerase sigma-54 factor
MKPSLQVRLSQHLALTPRLRQSIRLLQSTWSCSRRSSRCSTRTFLEADEDAAAPDAAVDRGAGTEPAAERSSEDTGFDAPDDAGGIDTTEFGGPERAEWENGTEGDDFDGIRELPSAAVAASADDAEAQERSTGTVSLQEHLRGQLAGMRLSAEDRGAVMALMSRWMPMATSPIRSRRLPSDWAATMRRRAKTCSSGWAAR